MGGLLFFGMGFIVLLIIIYALINWGLKQNKKINAQSKMQEIEEAAQNASEIKKFTKEHKEGDFIEDIRTIDDFNNNNYQS